MLKTFMNVSAVLSAAEKKNFNWQQYQGSTKDFNEERSRILDKEGHVKEEYQGREGYARYADAFYEGEMQIAYQNVSAVLSAAEKKNFNWQQYQGSTKDFNEERSRILDKEDHVKEEYQGREGYARYADDFYEGEMQIAYQNVSAVLGASEKKILNWQSYQGDTTGFREERSRILDEEGHVKEEYQNKKGYVRYADAFYGGEMKKNFSECLSSSECS